MTIPTYHGIETVTVALFNPLVLGGGYIRTMDAELTSYSHIISIEGGFISADISLNTSPIGVDEWLANGIGRHIVVYGSGGEVVWEGFIDNISVNMGNITIERGRLTEICNRCSVIYTPIIGWDDTGNPETLTEMPTLVVDNADSIAKYGIWEKVVSGGQIDVTEEAIALLGYNPADKMRDVYLADNKEPEISHSPILITESGSDVTVTLNCKGYFEWLNAYVYNNNAEEPESTDVTDKITHVLDADPNTIISTDRSFMEYNGSLVAYPESQHRMGLTVINEAVALGDADCNRWIFGIYEDRIPHFNAFSTQIDYLYYINSSNQRLENPSHAEIYPWNIRPGKLIFIPDSYLGAGMPTSDYRTDPRIMYLEQITFTAPQRIDLQGKKVRNFTQLLARKGL